MRVGNFSVLIPEGIEKTNGQVALDHGRQFTLRLSNHQPKRCDAILSVDGQHIADFRLGANSSLVVEGPPTGDRGRFTFQIADSEEGRQGGSGDITPVDRGLITVRFLPEYRMPVPRGVRGPFVGGAWSSNIKGDLRERSSTLCANNASTDKSLGGVMRTAGLASAAPTQAGITTLTGQNHQNWEDAEVIDHDPTGEVVIALRLIYDPNPPKVRPIRRVPTVPLAERP